MFRSLRLLTLRIPLAAYCKFSSNVCDHSYLGLFILKHSNAFEV